MRSSISKNSNGISDIAFQYLFIVTHICTNNFILKLPTKVTVVDSIVNMFFTFNSFSCAYKILLFCFVNNKI